MPRGERQPTLPHVITRQRHLGKAVSPRPHPPLPGLPDRAPGHGCQHGLDDGLGRLTQRDHPVAAVARLDAPGRDRHGLVADVRSLDQALRLDPVGGPDPRPDPEGGFRHVIGEAKGGILAIATHAGPRIENVALALEIDRDVRDPAREGIGIIGQPQMDRGAARQTMRGRPMLRGRRNQAREGRLVHRAEALLDADLTRPATLRGARGGHGPLPLEVDRPDRFHAMRGQHDHEVQELVLRPRGMQEDDDTALADPAIDQLARHHGLAHRHGPGLQLHLAQRGGGHERLGRRREQHRGPEARGKPHQSRRGKGRRDTTGLNCRTTKRHGSDDHRGHGSGSPGKATGRKGQAHQPVGCYEDRSRARHDTEGLWRSAQNQIAPLREPGVGKRCTKERAAADLERLPAQTAQHPMAATGRPVSPPPERRMIRPAGQIAAQIEGPGCAVMLPPGEGAISGREDCRCEDLLPLRDTDGRGRTCCAKRRRQLRVWGMSANVVLRGVVFGSVSHHPRPQVISRSWMAVTCSNPRSPGCSTCWLSWV